MREKTSRVLIGGVFMFFVGANNIRPLKNGGRKLRPPCPPEIFAVIAAGLYRAFEVTNCDLKRNADKSG